jgi:predicted exporter
LIKPRFARSLGKDSFMALVDELGTIASIPASGQHASGVEVNVFHALGTVLCQALGVSD